ncbi:MAG: hypothetical protein WKI04_10515 [Ferruginibacter sp.]
MKKFIAGLAFMLTVGLVNAQDSTSASTSGTKYDYYPESNVYYNDVTQTYWFHDSTSNQWKNAAHLPTGVAVDEKTQKNTFYYSGGDVWEKNADHVKMYGKKDKAKTEPKE